MEHFVLPQYTNPVPMRGTTIRITPEQFENLNKLTTATGAPSTASTMRLLLNNEYQLLQNGHCAKEDFRRNDNNKLFSFGFKLSESDKEQLATLAYFYGADSYSQVACHLIEKYTDIMNTDGSEKAVR